MKNGFYLGLILLLCFSLMSSMCSHDDHDDDDGGNNNSEQIAQIENNAESGTWRITNYNDSGQNETSDFAGYDFTFNSDGSLVATNGSDTLTGTWSATSSSSSSSSSSDIDFNIFFPVPDSNDFEDLNDDWDVVTYSSTRIELRDVSGGDGSTDLLTFQKN